MKHTFMQGLGLRKQFRHSGTYTYQECLRSRLTYLDPDAGILQNPDLDRT